MRVLLICPFLLTTSLLAQSDELITPVLPLSQSPVMDETFQWRSAFNESMRFLFLQHGFRMAFQPQTRKRMGGPFLRDYGASVKSVGGWGDNDPWWINYFGHPLQGSASGY